MKVILYARVSTTKIESDTVKKQLGELRRWASAKGLVVAGEFEDKCTGRELDCRDGLKMAIAAASKIGAPVAVVELSRLSRSVRDVIDLLESNTEFVFTRTGQQMDRMILIQMAWVAEYESVNISRRVSAGIQNHFARNPELRSSWGGGSRPDSVDKMVAGKVKKADAFALKVGKLAWDRRQAGWTWAAIAGEYMMMEIPTARGKVGWTPTGVKNLVERYGSLIERG
jgi:DNA invertase Pin-like site-specific DNA recombinase